MLNLILMTATTTFTNDDDNKDPHNRATSVQTPVNSPNHQVLSLGRFHTSLRHSRPRLPHHGGSLWLLPVSAASVALSPQCHVLLPPCHLVLPPIHQPAWRLLFPVHFSDSRSQFFRILWSESWQSALMTVIMFQDGMGTLRLNRDGIRLEGISEFLLPLYVNEIQSRRVSCSLCSSEQLRLAC